MFKYLGIATFIGVVLMVGSLFWTRLHATSDESLLSYGLYWKYYSGHCDSDVYRVTPEMLPNRDTTWSAHQRWDGRIFLTIRSENNYEPCVYIH